MIDRDIKTSRRSADYSPKAPECLRRNFADKSLAGKAVQPKRSQIKLAFAVDDQVFGQLTERAGVLKSVSAEPGDNPGAWEARQIAYDELAIRGVFKHRCLH